MSVFVYTRTNHASHQGRKIERGTAYGMGPNSYLTTYETDIRSVLLEGRILFAQFVHSDLVDSKFRRNVVKPVAMQPAGPSSLGSSFSNRGDNSGESRKNKLLTLPNTGTFPQLVSGKQGTASTYERLESFGTLFNFSIRRHSDTRPAKHTSYAPQEP